MFGIAKSRKLQDIEKILSHSQRGIHKRIDENRELLELLQDKAPEFLANHWWVEGWLRSQDEFLSDLLTAVPIPNALQSTNFPRPWPVVKAGETQAPLSTPAGWGLPDDIVFRVTRGDKTSSTPCTFAQLLDFLDACGMDPVMDEAKVAGILSGVPVEIDGASVQFEQVHPNGARLEWAMHAHPLKQITITLQGTRHSVLDDLLHQVPEVVRRIQAGDMQGEASDDDFGYKFQVSKSSQDRSVFGNVPSTTE